MKIKAIMCAAIAALAFASCSQDEDVTSSVQPSDSRDIYFSPIIQGIGGTRGIPITTENFKDNITSFQVFGYTDETDFTKDETFVIGRSLNDPSLTSNPGDLLSVGNYNFVTNQGNGIWSFPSQRYFWPKDDTKKVNFLAIAKPLSQDGFTLRPKGSNLMNLAYSTTGYSDYQSDLMIASTSTTRVPSVPLNFIHLLSSVSFNAKVSNERMEVVIQNVGVCNYIDRVSKDFDPRKDINSDLLYTTDNSSDESISRSPSQLVYGSGVTLSGKNSETKSLVGENGFVNLFIPQTLPAWDPATGNAEATSNRGVYLKVSCKIKYNGEYFVGDKDNYGNIYVPLALDWHGGKKYVYTLDFNGNGKDQNGKDIFNPVKLSLSVSDWANSSSSNISL